MSERAASLRALPDRIAAQPALVRLPLLFLTGAVAGLGQAPAEWPVLTLVALVAMIAVYLRRLAGNATIWSSFVHGWTFGAGYFGLSLHWIVEPFFIDAAQHGWMAPFALVFLASGMALFWGLAFASARLVGGRRDTRIAVLALIICWTGTEMLRSVVLTGFPWALIGHVWIDTPLAQMAAFAGAHGLTLFTLVLAAAIVMIGLRLWLAAPALIVALLWVALDPGPVPNADSDAPLIRIVQPNAPQDEKWDPARNAVFLDRMLGFTAAGEVPDLVVWPETAIPWLLDQAGPVLESASEAARGAPVVIGLQRREEARYFNSLAVIGRMGQVEALYDKHHLVPFGEYVPFGEIAERFGIRGLASSQGWGYSSGPGTALIDLPGIGTALPLICYEGIFAGLVNAAPARPRLLLLITNDAWFGQVAGPYQHFAQARLRAIEQGLPMIRAANTGVSGMIDGKGRVIRTIPLGEAGASDVALPPALTPPLYTKTGDWPLIVLIVIVFSGLGLRRRMFSD